MQVTFETNFPFVFMLCFIFTATFGEEHIEGAFVDCGTGDAYAWSFIPCRILSTAFSKGYTLHVLPLKNDRKIGENMKEVDTNKRAAWCTFPKYEDEDRPFHKGSSFRLHLQTPDLYLLALTGKSNQSIIGKHFLQVRKFQSCGEMKMELTPPGRELPISKRVDVKIEFDKCRIYRRVTWEMRRSYFSFKDENNCFNDALIGKLDMASFMSMSSSRPADVQTVGYLLPIPVYARPFGVTFFTATVHIQDKKFLISNYLKAPFEFAAQSLYELTIIFEPFPNTHFVWYEDRDLLLDASKSFSRQLSKVSGFLTDPSEFIRFQWKCEGRLVTCKSFPPEDEIGTVSKVIIPGNSMREGGKPTKITLTVHLVGEDFETILSSQRESKTIEVTCPQCPSIELRCVLNCFGPFSLKSLPRLVRFHCPSCYKDKYKIKWLGCKPPVCKKDAVYYEIPEDLEEFSLEVTNKRGSILTFTHKFNILQSKKYAVTKALSSLIQLPQSVHWFDVSRGLQEPAHPMLYRYMGTLKGDTVAIFWASNFNQHVLNVPYRLVGQDGFLSSTPRIQENYQWLDGTQYEIKTALLTGTGHAGNLKFTTKQLEELWKEILADLPFTQSATSAVILYANFLRNKWPEKDTDRILGKVMDYFLMKTISYTEALGILSLFFTEVTSKTVACTNSFLSKYLDVWRAAMDVLLKYPTLEFPDQECKTLESLSEMMNDCKGTLRSSNYDKFFSLLSNLSQHRAQVIQDPLTCEGSNWFMLWRTVSFYFDNSFKYEVPKGFEGRLKSVEFDKTAFKEVVDLAGFVDYEAYIAIYSISKSPYKLVYKDSNRVQSEILNIEFHERWNNERMSLYNRRDALSLVFEVAYNQLYYETVDFKALVEGKRVVDSECLIMRIPVSTTAPKILMLDAGDAFTFSMTSTIAHTIKEQINFIAQDEHKWTDLKGTVIISLLSRAKSYRFQHQSSHHVFILKGKSTKKDINGESVLELDYALGSIHCLHWDNRTHLWDFHMCFTVSYGKDLKEVECRCRNAVGTFTVVVFQSNAAVNTKVDGGLVTAIEERKGIAMLFFVLTLWLAYIALLVWARHKDVINQHLYVTNMALLHFNPSDRFRYLICMRMSSIPGSEMKCRVSLMLVGSLSTTGLMILDAHRYFMRGSESWFMVSTPKLIGNILGCTLKLEYPHVKLSWRIIEIDIYDIERDKLFVLPFNERVSMKNLVWTIHNADHSNNCTPRGIYIKDWFKKLLRTFHMILNILFPMPGAQKLVYDVTRLYCIILTSLAVALVFLSSWPTYYSPDDKKEGKGYEFTPFYSPIVLLVDIVLYFLLVLCSPYISWCAHWMHRMMPHSPRILGDRSSLEKNISYPHSGMLPTKTSQTQNLRNTVPLKSNYGHSIGHRNSRFSVLQRNKKFSRVSKFVAGVMANDSSFSGIKAGFRNQDSTSYAGSGVSSSLSDDDSPYTEIDDRQSMLNSASGPAFFTQYRMPSIEGVKEPETLSKDSKTGQSGLKEEATNMKWKKELPGHEATSCKILYSLLIALVVLYMFAVSWYIAQAGYYMLVWDVVETVVYTICVLLFHFVVQEPLFVFVAAFMCALKNRVLYCQAWARKRASMAEGRIYFWKELEEFNYKRRVSAHRPHEYKRKEDAYHAMINMYFKRDKLASKIPSEDKGPLQSSRKADKKGTSAISMTIIVLFIITLYHTKANECYNEKVEVFNSLGLSRFGGAFIKETKTVEGLWQEMRSMLGVNLMFKREREAGMVAQKIAIFALRQLRVKPNHEHCSITPTLQPLLFPRRRCQYELNLENEETRHFASNWRSPAQPGQKIPVGTGIASAFLYTKSTILQEMYSGNIGGYYYVPGTLDGETFDTLEVLENANWIDENTRAIILELSIFNTNNGIGSAVQVVFEFQASGVFMSASSASFPLIYRRSEYIVLALALFVLGLQTLVSLTKELQLLNHIGKKCYWGSGHHVGEFILSFNSVILMVCFSYRFYLTKDKLTDVAAVYYGTDFPIFITLQDLSALVTAVNAISAFVAFAILFKILKMASYIKRLGVMLELFYDVFGLFLTPLVVTLSLAIFFMIMFHSSLFYYSNFWISLTTTSQFIISPLKIHQDIRKASIIIGPLMILLQWVMFLLVVVNGFIVAINEGFSVKSRAHEGTSNSKSNLESTYELALNIVGIDLPEKKETEGQKETGNKENINHLLNNAV